MQYQANGKLFISGEMEITINQGIKKAFEEADRIANACGYLAAKRGNYLEIIGGNMLHECVLEFRADAVISTMNGRKQTFNLNP